MNEHDFNREAGAMMVRIEAAVEALAEVTNAELDFDLGPGGVLTIDCADGGQIIINRHAVAQEIWVAARAGGFHFRYLDGDWVDSRDGEALLVRLSLLLSAQLGEAVSL